MLLCFRPQLPCFASVSPQIIYKRPVGLYQQISELIDQYLVCLRWTNVS